MISIKIASKVEQEVSPDQMEMAARETIRQQGAPEADLSLVITSDEEIRGLNRQFSGKDEPTDVLSFSASETDPETGRRYIGDVIISLPRAREQAQSAGHGVNEEVQLLVIHGVLHLLGHDHAEMLEKERMWTAQGEILKRIGVKIEVKG